MQRQIFKNSFGESYTLATLDNGLKIYLMPKKEFNTAYAVYGTKYGSIDTSFTVNGETLKVPEGIAHYLEHKLFESEDGDAFTRYAETGGYANAFTSFDRTCYLFSCTNRFYDNLDILLDFVQSPYFTAETVQKEQGIIGQEIRMYDDSANWCVLFNMLGAMYHNHPVKIDIAGTTDSIAKINADLLYKCYNTFYHPSNMFVCIAGNFDLEETLNRIEKAIKPNSPIEFKRETVFEPETIVKPYVEKHLAVALPVFCLGFKENAEKQADVKQKIVTAITLDYLSGEASPLYAKLINKGLINDEFSSEYFTGLGYTSTIFEGESNNPKAVKENILSEIKSIIENGINNDYLNAVKKSAYGEAVRRFNSVEGLCMQLTECAMTDCTLFDDLEAIKSVTADDVIEKLKLLREENAVLSVILPKE